MHLPFLGFERNRKRDFNRLLNTTHFLSKFSKFTNFLFLSLGDVLVLSYYDSFNYSMTFGRVNWIFTFWLLFERQDQSQCIRFYTRFCSAFTRSTTTHSWSRAPHFVFLQFGIKYQRYLSVWDFEIRMNQQERIIAWLFW